MARVDKYRTIEYLESRRIDESAKRLALTDARRIAEYLNDQCNAVVFGIGSLFDPDRVFGPHSDIDLVVKGIPSERFFSITARAALLTNFDVDIIPLEEADELIKRRIDESGVQL